MKTEQTIWSVANGWQPRRPGASALSPQLVFLFGSTAILADGAAAREAGKAYPKASLVGCSTAGEICGTSVSDDSLVVTAAEFAHTRIQVADIAIGKGEGSHQAGERLARSLKSEGLVHVFVLSEGLNINGSELVQGISKHLPAGVAVTGGLSGDGAHFKETLVVRDGRAARDAVVAVGFYGERLRVGYGSFGGWDTFGPERLITRSKGNVLYELDGKSALELYKKYLGEHAAGLPASGLLFPLSVRSDPAGPGVVRTILAVNEEEQCMTFAGDVTEGAYARLMKANFDRLIDGAVGAARASHGASDGGSPDLAILISCVGRKMVLQQRVEEEVEGVRDVLGEHTTLTGFYSYGEISPFKMNEKCELHNQTMTVTTFSEE